LTHAANDRVARAFHVALAALFLVAWWSLGRQVIPLVGEHGLLPANAWLDAVRSHDVGGLDVPTLFRFGASDAALVAGVWAGVALSLASLFGFFSRIAFAANVALYLSYAVVCRTFLAFQWDNLLLECGTLAALLPVHRRAQWAHFLVKLLLFKLYFESGLAKWQSSLHDWQDGSAMTYYYETAPIPTWLAWFFHHLPTGWHHLESWSTLAFELGGPFLIFGPRPARLLALGVFSLFQLVNVATANYGFFSYLALALSVLLLDNRDVRTLGAWWRRRLLRARRWSKRRRLRRAHAAVRIARRRLHAVRRWTIAREPRTSEGQTFFFIARLTVAALAVTLYAGVSLQRGVSQFWRGGPESTTLVAASQALAPLRIVNNYHLFASITRERIEPIFEISDGTRFTEHDLDYKPGDPRRAPPFVAPHQPRLDFSLWFYGLRAGGQPPDYVVSLLLGLCDEPRHLQAFFESRLPDHAAAVRVVFYRYHFSTPEQRADTGAWWTREPVGAPRGVDCERVAQ
jgi:hypothetical protein